MQTPRDWNREFLATAVLGATFFRTSPFVAIFAWSEAAQ